MAISHRFLVFFSVSLVVVACLGATTLTGCSRPSSPSVAANPAQPGAAPVNKVCPIMKGQPVTPGLTRQFHGQTVGFCCASCMQSWDRMSERQKQGALNAALQKS